jgi:hypothetical protein
MKSKRGTDAVIAEMVNASCRKDMSARERHLFRESLRNLVRLAQSELLTEMRSNVCRLTGLVQPARRPRILEREPRPLQQGFEFNQ